MQNALPLLAVLFRLLMMGFIKIFVQVNKKWSLSNQAPSAMTNTA